ncbi:MAG: dihydrofolate reductase [Myxococcota bacterium]
MIRLAFMTDPSRVIGARDAEANAARFPLLPSALKGVMETLYKSAHVVVGADSIGPWQDRTDTTVYALTRDAERRFEAAHIRPTRDVSELIERFADSDEELLIAGGRTVLGLFLDHAERIDVAETDSDVPGDLVFADWDTPRFVLESSEPWDGGRTLHLVRRGVRLRNGIALYEEGIRDGQPDVVRRYTGARYTQHSTGVPDGTDGFLEFFTEFLQRNTTRDIRVLRAVEDGRYAFVHVAQELNGGAARWITMDLFDTDADGKIVEHWDVIQAWTDESQVTGESRVDLSEPTERNKAVVRTMMNEVFIYGDITRIGEFVAEDVVVHQPGLGSGLQPWRDQLAAEFARGTRYDFVFRLIGQGNFVVTFSRVKGADGGRATFEVFRLADGRVVEVWSTAEPIPTPEEARNVGKF